MRYHPILLALALTASAAHAQHATTMTLSPDTFTVRTDGPVPVVAVELLAGDGATFAAGTEGDLSWGNRVTTLTVNGGSGSFAISFDTFSPFPWVGSRALVLWDDGFERIVPTSRGMDSATYTFNYTDIPPVPEPGAAALALAGLALVAGAARARRN